MVTQPYREAKETRVKNSHLIDMVLARTSALAGDVIHCSGDVIHCSGGNGV